MRDGQTTGRAKKQSEAGPSSSFAEKPFNKSHFQGTPPGTQGLHDETHLLRTVTGVSLYPHPHFAISLCLRGLTVCPSAGTKSSANHSTVAFGGALSRAGDPAATQAAGANPDPTEVKRILLFQAFSTQVIGAEPLRFGQDGQEARRRPKIQKDIKANGFPDTSHNTSTWKMIDGCVGKRTSRIYTLTEHLFSPTLTSRQWRKGKYFQWKPAVPTSALNVNGSLEVPRRRKQ